MTTSKTPKADNPEAQTFNDPNAGLIGDTEKKQLIESGKMADADEVDTLNKEIVDDYRGQGAVSVEEVYLKEADDPLMSVMSESDVKEMQDYTQEDLNKQQVTENLNREFYRKWQGRQSDWVAFIKKGYDDKTKRVLWQKRTYKIHDLVQEDKDQIQGLLYKLENIETRKNYLQYLGARNEDNYKEYISRDWGGEISSLVKQVRNLKFLLYFGENNAGIMDKIRWVDSRDLIDAAERREEKLPPSRKLQSSRSTLSANTLPEIGKEVSSTNKSPAA